MKEESGEKNKRRKRTTRLKITTVNGNNFLTKWSTTRNKRRAMKH
jgi:hypothetical protein